MELHICQKRECRQNLQPWQCGLRYPDIPPMTLSTASAACQKFSCSFPSSTLKMTAAQRKQESPEGETGDVSELQTTHPPFGFQYL